MSWQDFILAAGAWIFAIALLPSVFGKDKPAFSSSLITGSVLAVYIVAYISLSLWVAAVSVSITTALWFILAIQKYLIFRRKSS